MIELFYDESKALVEGYDLLVRGGSHLHKGRYDGVYLRLLSDL